jgi:hypothetical protein
MSPRRQFLKSLGQSFVSGLVAALVANAVWLAITGGTPSYLTTLATSQVVTWLYGARQAYRFHRKWQAVLASYERPALGEGIDIPHRPPVDNDRDGGAA